jgi:hypothetical protein
MRPGPNPEIGTPQYRFRQAMMALNDQGRAAREARRDRYSSPDLPATGLADRGPRASGANVYPISQPPRAANRNIPTGFSYPASPKPTAVLTRECQKRRFNPVFRTVAHPGGKFGCEVRVDDRLVRTDRPYDCIADARMAVATKALTLMGWREYTSRDVPRERQTPRLGSVATQGLIARAVDRDPDAAMADAGVDGATAFAMALGATRADEQAELWARVRQMMDASVAGPSRENPELNRAFLEGLAFGVRLARPASMDIRSRSRSPPSARRTAGYRVRSPARQRLTPPPTYQSYPGRPNSDRYRPGA